MPYIEPTQVRWADCDGLGTPFYCDTGKSASHALFLQAGGKGPLVSKSTFATCTSGED